LKELEQGISKNRNLLNEIIEFYSDYNYYVASIQDCVKLTLFFIVFINSIGIALCVAVLCKWSIINGCAVLIIVVCEVTIPCILGSIVEHQNERIVKAIYAFPFYELDVGDQKTFLQFLMFAQNSANLSLQFFGTVNLELLGNILNGGYSYFTYIKSFL
jgi:7tm Odorant receptor